MPNPPRSLHLPRIAAPARVRELEAELEACREEAAAQVEQARQVAVRAVGVKVDELNAANAKLDQAVAFINRIGDGSAGKLAAALRAAQDELAVVEAKTERLRAEQKRHEYPPLVPPAPAAAAAPAPREFRWPSLGDIPTGLKVAVTVLLLVLTFFVPGLGVIVALGSLVLALAGLQALVVGHALWAGLLSRGSGLAMILLAITLSFTAMLGATMQAGPQPDVQDVQISDAPLPPAPAPEEPAPAPEPPPAPAPAPEPPPAPAPAPAPVVSYKNCTAVKEAGAAPITRGQPGYGDHLDNDGDGVGCES